MHLILLKDKVSIKYTKGLIKDYLTAYTKEAK